MLRFCCQELSKPLHTLFQASLNQCKVPSLWKPSEITPVPKLKQPLIMNDLRPVALTSVVMKCSENVVRNPLFEYIDPFKR